MISRVLVRFTLAGLVGAGCAAASPTVPERIPDTVPERIAATQDASDEDLGGREVAAERFASERHRALKEEARQRRAELEAVEPIEVVDFDDDHVRPDYRVPRPTRTGNGNDNDSVWR